MGLLLAYIGVALVYKSGLIHGYIKGIVEEALTTAFRREIRVASLSGNLFSRAQLNTVHIAHEGDLNDGVFMDIDTLVAEYDLIKIIQLKGDFLAGIHTVLLKGGDIHVLRTKDDFWNLFDFVVPPPLPEGVPPPPLTFRGRIIAQDISGTFTDEKGWGVSPLETPFSDAFTDLSCSLDFGVHKKVSLDVSGYFLRDNTPLAIKGFLDVNKGKFKLHLDIPLLNVDYWGDYLFPLDGFEIFDNTVHVKGSLISKFPMPKNDIPFFYDLNMDFSNVKFKLPLFNEPLSKLKGRLRLHNLKHPSFYLDRFQGHIEGISFNGHGEINPFEDYINLSLKTKDFNLLAAKKIIPVLEDWSYQGQGYSTFKIKGRLNRPRISGHLFAKTFYSYGIPLKEVEAYYSVYNNELAFEVKKGHVFGGDIQGNGLIKYRDLPASLDIKLEAKNMRASALFPELTDHVSGTVNLSAKSKGSWDDFSIDIHATGPSFKAFNQSLEKISMRLHVLEQQHITIQEGIFKPQKDGVAAFQGTLDQFKDLHLIYSIQDLSLFDVARTVKQADFGWLTASGSIQGDISIRPFHALAKSIKVKSNLTLKHGVYNGHAIDSIHAKLYSHNGHTNLEHLNAKKKSGTVSLSAKFQGLTPISGQLIAKNWSLEAVSLLAPFLSYDMMPQSGFFSGDLTWKPSSIHGHVILDNIKVKELSLDHVELVFSKDKALWQLYKAELRQKQSRVFVDGYYHVDTGVDLTIQPSKVYLEDVKELSQAWGDLSGSLSLEGHFSGSLEAPNVSLKVDGKHVSWGPLTWQGFKGHITYENDILHLSPLEVFHEEGGRYVLEGCLALDETGNNQPYVGSLVFEGVPINNMLKSMEALYKRGSDKITELNQESSPVVIGDVQIKRKPLIPIYAPYLKHDSLRLYDQIKQSYEKDSELVSIDWADYFSGRLSGMIDISASNQVSANLRLKDSRLGILSAQKIEFNITGNNKRQSYTFLMRSGDLGGSPLNELFSQGWYEQGMLQIGRLDMATPFHHSKDILKGTFPLAAFWDASKQNEKISLMLELDNHEIDSLSLLTPYIKSIRNNGFMRLHLGGNMQKPILSSQDIHLKHAELIFNPETTMFHTSFKLPEERLFIKENTLYMESVQLIWKGTDTVDRESKKVQENKMDLSGTVMLQAFNIINLEEIGLTLNLAVDPMRWTINFPDLVQGDISFGPLTIQGPYPIALNKRAHKAIMDTIATPEEIGALIKGDVRIKRAKIAFPKIAQKKDKPFFRFDMGITLEEGVSIEGGIWGEGIFRFANYFYLELGETNASPIHLGGSLNALNLDQPIVFTSGAISFFDRLYELMPLSQQRQFFIEQPSLVGPNTVSFINDFLPGDKKPQLIPVLDIKSLTFIEDLEEDLSTTNIELTYRGIVLSVKGRMDALDGAILVEEYQVNNPASSLLNPQLLSRQSLSLQDSDNSFESQDALTLILPETLTASSGASEWEALGAKQANLFFRSTIRPYERKIAKGLGVKEFRFEYNIGQSLFLRDQISGDYGELIGLNITETLIKDRSYIRVKSEINLGTSSRSDLQGLKMTELEWNYFFTPKFSINIMHRSDYWEYRPFNPLGALQISHEF